MKQPNSLSASFFRKSLNPEKKLLHLHIIV